MTPACIIEVHTNKINQYELSWLGGVTYIKPVCIIKQRLQSCNFQVTAKIKSKGSIQLHGCHSGLSLSKN